MRGYEVSRDVHFFLHVGEGQRLSSYGAAFRVTGSVMKLEKHHVA